MASLQSLSVKIFISACVLIASAFTSLSIYSRLKSVNPNSINFPSFVTENVSISLRPCNIVVAHGPDPFAAYATLIWTYPINFFIYAERTNSTLWIDFNSDYNNICNDSSMEHDNVWNYYLNPIDPHSQHCNVNTSNYTVLSKHFVFPEIHYVKRMGSACMVLPLASFPPT